MKIALLFSLITVIFLSFQALAEEQCDLPSNSTGTPTLENLSNDSIQAACAEFEKINKCNERSISEETLLEQAQRKFRTPKYVKLLDDFSFPSETNSFNSDTLKQKLIKQYVSYGKDNSCPDPILYLSPRSHRMSTENQFKASDRHQIAKMKKLRDEYKNSNEFENKVRSYVSEVNAKSLESLTLCSKGIQSFDSTGTIEASPRCVGDITSFYPDNKAKISEQDLSKRLASNQSKDISSCINEKISQGHKIKAIRIKSSANALQNTSSIEEIKRGDGFCGYDFEGLSRARAEFAKNSILPGILNGEKVKDEAISMDFLGTNGDGTSGPCPYDEKGNLLPKYASSKKELEKFKFSSVEVIFEDNQKDASVTEQDFTLAIQCKQINIKCND